MMMKKMKRVFKSKVDTLLVALILLVFAPIILLLLTDFSLMALIIVALTLLFTMSLLFGIRYVIDDNKLIVKCSFLFSQEYDIRKIKSIKSTHTFLSAPAASLDRLEIDFGNDSVVVSPKDKKAFVDLISSPDIPGTYGR